GLRGVRLYRAEYVARAPLLLGVELARGKLLVVDLLDVFLRYRRLRRDRVDRHLDVFHTHALGLGEFAVVRVVVRLRLLGRDLDLGHVRVGRQVHDAHLARLLREPDEAVEGGARDDRGLGDRGAEILQPV